MTTHLKLFVAGSSPRSSEVVKKTKEIVERFTTDCVVDVVDILDHPDEAEAQRIIATPTLVRLQPLPERRVIGDISDPQTLIDAFGLSRAM